jgi:hypothetical protein
MTLANGYAADEKDVMSLGEPAAAVDDSPPGYTGVVQDYLADIWEASTEKYLSHDLSGIDRAQETVAAAVAGYEPDLEHVYAQAVGGSAAEFGRSFGQALAGAMTSPAALYDAVQEWQDDDVQPLSPYVHIETRREDDGSVPGTAGKAAGFLTGAAAGVHYPVLFLAGAAHSGRHLAERAVHRYLREHLVEDGGKRLADERDGCTVPGEDGVVNPVRAPD